MYACSISYQNIPTTARKRYIMPHAEMLKAAPDAQCGTNSVAPSVNDVSMSGCLCVTSTLHWHPTVPNNNRIGLRAPTMAHGRAGKLGCLVATV